MKHTDITDKAQDDLADDEEHIPYRIVCEDTPRHAYVYPIVYNVNGSTVKSEMHRAEAESNLLWYVRCGYCNKNIPETANASCETLEAAQHWLDKVIDGVADGLHDKCAESVERR